MKTHSWVACVYVLVMILLLVITSMLCPDVIAADIAPTDTPTNTKSNTLEPSEIPIDYLKEDISTGKNIPLGNLEKRLKGRTPEQVKQLIGTPELITGQLESMWGSAKGRPIDWFYYTGLHSIQIRVAFFDGYCISTSLSDGRERLNNENAAFREIEAYSLGKTKEEISAYLPKPLRQLTGEHVWAPINQFKFDRASDVCEYMAGDDCLLQFRFTDNKCTAVKHPVLFH